MSENITHLAVYEDCCSILNKSSRFCSLFTDSINEFHDLGRMGSGTRGADRNTLQLLSRYRELHKEGKLSAREKAGIAFIMGWLTHRAADREFKLVFKESDPESFKNNLDPSDCSCYHDVYSFKVPMKEGKKLPYTPRLLDTALASELMSSDDSLRFERAVGASWQQSFLDLHNKQLHATDPDALAGMAIERFADHYVDLLRYHKALTNPDPDKRKRFITDINFYDAKDPVIVLAGSTSSKQSLSDVAYQASLNGNQSHYARSVVRGIRYIEAANDFFLDKITADETSSLLDIGKPELINLK